jgi:hypothetical protein
MPLISQREKTNWYILDREFDRKPIPALVGRAKDGIESNDTTSPQRWHTVDGTHDGHVIGVCLDLVDRLFEERVHEAEKRKFIATVTATAHAPPPSVNRPCHPRTLAIVRASLTLRRHTERCAASTQ